MKNIARIIVSDLKGLSRSFMALLLVAAMLALPALYAWLNIYACWDPYENISGIGIAIYSEDQDYTLDNGKVVNMSDDMLDELREESSIGWTMVDSRDEAIDGVYDGTYYASVVIEKDFTARLFDFNGSNKESAPIAFYQNQKKNAIATRMTDSASNTLKRCLSQAYIKALMAEVFGHFNGWNDYAGELDGDADDSQVALQALKDNMDNYSHTLSAFISANNLLVDSLDETDLMVDDAVNGIYSSADNIDQQNEIIKSVQADLEQDVKDATESLNTLQTHLDDLDKIVIRIGEVGTVNDMSKSLKETKNLLITIKDSLKNIQKVLNVAYRLDKDVDTIGGALCDNLDYLLEQTDELLKLLENNYDKLTEFSTHLNNVLGTAVTITDPAIKQNFTIMTKAAGQSAQDVSTYVTAILVAKRGYNLQEIAATSPTAISSTIASTIAEEGTTDSNALLTSALTYLGTGNSGNPFSEMEPVSTDLTYFSSDDAAEAIKTSGTIKSRAAKLNTQYKNIQNELPNVLNAAGLMMEDLGVETGTETMIALEAAIMSDIKDTVEQLTKLENLGSSTETSSKSDIANARLKVYKTQMEIKAMRLAFKGIGGDAPDVDADDAINVTNQLIDRLDDLQKVLDDAQKLLDTTGDATESINKAKALAASTVDYINNSMWPVMDKTLTQMEEVMDDISALLIHATDSMVDGKEVLNGVNITMMGANNSLVAVQDVLGLLASRISPIIENIEDIQDAEIIADLRSLLGLDPDAVSDYISSPVGTSTESIYAVDNYGSGMAPFYTSLAIWIGNIILAAVLKVQPSRKGLRRPKTWELFFGRYFIFFLMNEVQALIIMLGNLFILKIQCGSPGLYIVTGLLAALAFSMLIYALVLSFGVLGKAISVLLFIMQIAGSGGTYPIELLPDQFRALHKFLPFDYSIGAMRSAIAGIYHNDLYIDLAVLGVIVLVAVYIGLKSKVFRGFTDYMEEQMEESNLMV